MGVVDSEYIVHKSIQTLGGASAKKVISFFPSCMIWLVCSPLPINIFFIAWLNLGLLILGRLLIYVPWFFSSIVHTDLSNGLFPFSDLCLTLWYLIFVQAPRREETMKVQLLLFLFFFFFLIKYFYQLKMCSYWNYFLSLSISFWFTEDCHWRTIWGEKLLLPCSVDFYFFYVSFDTQKLVITHRMIGFVLSFTWMHEHKIHLLLDLWRNL